MFQPAWAAGLVTVAVLLTCLAVANWWNGRTEHARTRETLARLDGERRAELDKLELAGRLDPYVRGTIAGGQVGVGRSVSGMDDERAYRAPRIIPCDPSCRAHRAEVDVEIAALRADVNRLLAERPQGYRRAG